MLASVSNVELARLFSGDALSAGYYDDQLVLEICRRVNPATFERLASFVFDSKPLTQIDPEAYEVLREGYEWWEEDVRLQKERLRERSL